ncbi:hypothetical protein N7470_001858 [Penicillium chermesinum]|nr:hypothetical protein N7470_001858 [Penicillium chermesinum]
MEWMPVYAQSGHWTAAKPQEHFASAQLSRHATEDLKEHQASLAAQLDASAADREMKPTGEAFQKPEWSMSHCEKDFSISNACSNVHSNASCGKLGLWS